MIKRLVVMLAAFLSVTPAVAQESWPQRPVKFIIPVAAGAGADIGARLLAERLTVRWGQPVVVENRIGGDGVIAMDAFTAARDPHTLLVTPTSAFVHHPWAMDKLSYDPRDVVPIARISNTVVAVVVPSSLPVNSFAELAALARAKPGTLNSATITGLLDLVVAGFMKKAGLQIEWVPYRNPIVAVTDLSEGRLHLMVPALAIVQPMIAAGKLKLLAVTGPQRAAVAPDTPTMAEAGFPDMTFEGLVAVFGMRPIADTLRDRISADIRETLAEPATAARLSATGQVVNPGGPAELEAAVGRQRQAAAEAGKILGIKEASF